MDSNVPIKDAFKIADDVLRQGVKGISEIITVGCGGAGQTPKARGVALLAQSRQRGWVLPPLTGKETGKGLAA